MPIDDDQYYHQAKLTDMNIFQVKKYYLLVKVEKTNFTDSPLGKAFEKQIQTIEDQGTKQVKALKVLAPDV